MSHMEQVAEYEILCMRDFEHMECYKVEQSDKRHHWRCIKCGLTIMVAICEIVRERQVAKAA